jgi:hypothetical protein
MVRPLQRCGATLLLLLAAFSLGCGSRGTVSGQVHFNGKPLPGGVVKFTSPTGSYNPVTSAIGEDGSYSLTVPSGEALVSVDNRGLKTPNSTPVGQGGAPSGGGKDGPPKKVVVAPPNEMMAKMKEEHQAPAQAGSKSGGTYVAIPDKYYKPESSDLKCNVQGGLQTHNIELSK